jgi:hypothetical protein
LSVTATVRDEDRDLRFSGTKRYRLPGQHLIRRSKMMQDVLWIAVTVAFFALSIAYVHFCERVK